MTISERLKEFIESEGKSCSFDPELITPEYVYRMWGGKFSIEEIATGLTELRKQGTFMVHGSRFKVNSMDQETRCLTRYNEVTTFIEEPHLNKE